MSRIAQVGAFSDDRAMSRLGIFAHGAGVAGAALVAARETLQAAAFVYGDLAAGTGALAIAGWSLATLGPLALSMWFWRTSQGLARQWLLHLLFIPCAIALHRAGASILFLAADVPDGDSIEGYALLAASGFLALTLLVHGGTLAALGVAAIKGRAPPG